MNDEMDRIVVNAVPPRYGSLRHAARYRATNSDNLLRVELGAIVGYSARTAAFGNHVGRIVGVCSQEEMVRVNTRGVVAVMQDTQAFGYQVNK